MIHKVPLLKTLLAPKTLTYFKYGAKKITAIQLNNYVTK